MLQYFFIIVVFIVIENAVAVARKTIIDFGADEYAYTIALQGPYILLGGYKGASLALARLNNSHAALPVKLLDFTAHKKDHSVLLEWRTESEFNTSRFEIERSEDGSDFKNLGKIKSTGAGNVRTTYTFTDKSPFAGDNYYRLKQVDKNGNFIYTPIRLVSLNTTQNLTIAIYPQPAKKSCNYKTAFRSEWEKSDIKHY